MFKKILAKRAENLDFIDGSLLIDVNGESLSLFPRDIKDILIDRNENSVVLIFGANKVTINLKSQEKFEIFCSDFYNFFSRKEFLRLKKDLIQRLLFGGFLVCPIILYVYFNYFERFNAIVYFLTGIFLYSIVITFSHIKDLNTFFNKQIE